MLPVSCFLFIKNMLIYSEFDLIKLIDLWNLIELSSRFVLLTFNVDGNFVERHLLEKLFNYFREKMRQCRESLKEGRDQLRM